MENHKHSKAPVLKLTAMSIQDLPSISSDSSSGEDTDGEGSESGTIVFSNISWAKQVNATIGNQRERPHVAT